MTINESFPQFISRSQRIGAAEILQPLVAKARARHKNEKFSR